MLGHLLRRAGLEAAVLEARSWKYVDIRVRVEYAHAIAPGANSLIVATPVSETEGQMGSPEIVKATNYVIDDRLADVITQSLGATDEAFKNPRSLLSLRGAFVNAALHGVTVLGPSGDNGRPT